MLREHFWAVAAFLVGAALFCGNAAVADDIVTARFDWAYTVDNNDGSFAVGLETSVANRGDHDLANLKLILLGGPTFDVIPGDNVLEIGSLSVGGGVDLTWEITALNPLDESLEPMIIVATGEATDSFGEPIYVPVAQVRGSTVQ